MVRPLWNSGCRDPKKLKKGGCLLIILHDRGSVRVFATNILYLITTVSKFILETFQNNNLVKYDICNTENSLFNADLKGLFLCINEKRGL